LVAKYIAATGPIVVAFLMPQVIFSTSG
jgi:hypothetical protein